MFSQTRITRSSMLVVPVFLCASVATCQPTQSWIDGAEKQLDGSGALEFNRLTTDGRLSSCELSYRYTQRDVRARKGKLVGHTGSVVIDRFPGRVFGFRVKATANEVTIKPDATVSLHPLEPGSVNMELEGILTDYRKGQFQCEGGGRCAAFVDDPNFSLVRRFTGGGVFSTNFAMLVLVPPAMTDTRVPLGKIALTSKESSVALGSFSECGMEVVSMMADDLKKLPGEKR